MAEKTGRFALPPAVYDVAKDTALIYLPATAVLYSALAVIWGWGYVAEVTGTAVAIGTFLGVVLKISKTSYDNSDKGKDGVLLVDKSGPTDIYRMDFSTPMDEVADKKTVTLRIDPNAQLSSMDPRLLEPGSQ